MSKVVSKLEERQMANVVNVLDCFYYVDSADTFDFGYETMAFKSDKDGNVSDWGDLYCRRYASEEEMKIGHDEICSNLEEYIDVIEKE